jgi:chorismate mutase
LERISALRKKVDEIDEEILRFLKERMEVCKSIGAIKREHGIPIRDHQREDEIYTNIVRKASKLELNPQKVKAIYQKIMAMSTHAQEPDTKT